MILLECVAIGEGRFEVTWQLQLTLGWVTTEQQFSLFGSLQFRYRNGEPGLEFMCSEFMLKQPDNTL